jgi:hypothetical protein
MLPLQKERERRIRFLYVYSVMYVSKLVFSLFLIFFGYLLSSMRTSESERGREKKNRSIKKKRMEKKKKKKKSSYVCMSIYLAWLVRMAIKRNHYQVLNIHKLTIISLINIVET